MVGPRDELMGGGLGFEAGMMADVGRTVGPLPRRAVLLGSGFVSMGISVGAGLFVMALVVGGGGGSDSPFCCGARVGSSGTLGAIVTC
jgi:hypothetical protein